MNAQIHVIKSNELRPKLRQQILALCSDAYEEDFTPYLELLTEATHVLATLGGQPVSHAAWVKRELRVGKDRKPLCCAYVEAVATPVRLQRQGLGTQVLRAIPGLVAELDMAALSPSEPDFYARSGWEMWQGPLLYMENRTRHATPDEEVMILRLPKTPTGIDLRDELEADWRAGEVW